MKKLLLIIIMMFILRSYADHQQLPEQESAQPQDFFKLITDYVQLQDAHEELEQLRRHAQTVSKLLWLEKNEKNIELYREIVRRYLKALEKLPEYDEQKQTWKKTVQDLMKKNDRSQQKESCCYTAA